MAISFLTGESVDGLITANEGVQFSGGSIGTAKTVLHTNNVIYSRGGSGGMFLQNSDGSDGIFIANDHVRVETNSSERLRIDNSGNSTFTGNLTVGSTSANNRKITVLASDSNTAGFEAYGNSQGTGYVWVGQSSVYGGGMFYNGDGSPSFATGEINDAISFYRRGNNTPEVAFYYLYNSNNVTFRGDISVSGGDITLGGTGRIQGVDTVTANTDAANKLYVDNAIAGVPQGDITGVTAGDGMTGGGSSGSVTLDVVGGDGITANANDVEITPAQTTITSIHNTGLEIGGATGVNEIFFGAGKISFSANSTSIYNVYSGGVRPSSNNTMTLGTSGNKWSSVYATTFLGSLNGTINTATTGVTQSQGNNSTKIATTAYVDSYNSGVQTINEGVGIKVSGTTSPTIQVNYDSGDSDNLIIGATTQTSSLNSSPYSPYILIADSNPGLSSGPPKKVRLQSIPLDRFGDATSTIDMGGNKILDVANPTSAQDAATKAYVDANSGSGTVTGTGSNTRVAFWSSSSALTSDADLTYATATNRLSSGAYIIPNNGDYLGTDTSGSARTLITLDSGNDVEISHAALSLNSDTNIYFGDNFRVKDGNSTRLSIQSNGTMSNSGNTFNCGPINLEEDNKITFDDDGDQWNYIQATSGQMEMGVGQELTLLNEEEGIFGGIKVQELYNIVDGLVTNNNATYIPVYTDSSSSTTARVQRQQTPARFLSNAGAITGSGTSGRVAFFTGTRTVSSDTLYWNSSTNVLGINYSGSTFNSGALQIQGPTTNSGQIGLQIYNSTSGNPYGSHGIYVNGPRYGNGGISIKNPNVGSTFMRFYNSSGSTCGTITQSGSSSTSFNTSSDYRLKENIIPMTGSIDRLKQLKPSKFNFINQNDLTKEASPTVDGFIAHEVSDIIPEAITGEKDGLDYEGNPEYQSIDQSKIVPLLTGALQEAISKIESLEARIKALES